METKSIETLRAFMQSLTHEIAGLGIYKRDIRRYPFDSVADEVLSKAAALVKSVLILIEADQPEEAFGLSRSITECALNLRWITAEPAMIQSRADVFSRYGFTVKNFWYWWVKKNNTTGPIADDADRYAAEWSLVEDAGGAFKHWSGDRQFIRTSSRLQHPLSQASSDQDVFDMRRAIDYFDPSGFVHCGQPGVDSYFSDHPFLQIHRNNPDPRDFAAKAIHICHANIHDIVLYVLFGMNVYLSRPLESLTRHTFEQTFMEYRFEEAQ